MNPQNHTNNHCAIWSILFELIPVKTNVSVISSYAKHFNTINIENKDFKNALQIKDIPKLENLNNLCIIVFQLDNLIYMKLLSIRCRDQK